MADTAKTGVAELERFYSALERAQADALRKSDQLLEMVEQEDAEGTFRKGDALLLAHAAVPEGCFLEWCSFRWPKHRTYAYRFMRVAERLAPHRTRLVRARINRSSLLELAKKPELAEEIAAAYEAGPRPTVAQIKAMIGAGAPALGTDDLRSRDVGGPRGLRLLHDTKRRHLKDLANRFERMIETMEVALAAPRVLKGELAAAVNMEARWAQAELRNLCAFIEPASWDTSKPAPIPFADGSGWDRAMRLLYELGGSEHWPPKGDMADWLRQTVLPLLKWAARGGAVPPDNHATLEQGEPLSPVAIPSSGNPENEGGDLDNQASICEAPRATEAGSMSQDVLETHDAQEEPPLLSTASVTTAASFLSLLRQRYLREGVSPEAVEDTCLKAAQALASSLDELGKIGALPSRPPATVVRLTESIYRASQSAPPTVPSILSTTSAAASRAHREVADPVAARGDRNSIRAAMQIVAQQAITMQAKEGNPSGLGPASL